MAEIENFCHFSEKTAFFIMLFISKKKIMQDFYNITKTVSSEKWQKISAIKIKLENKKHN